MSLWKEHDIEDKVCAALENVTFARKKKGHHFERPFMTAYQLALKVHEVDPDLIDKLGKKLGGADGVKRDSLARYLANQLSKRIKKHGVQFRVEGAFLSNDSVDALRYTTADGTELLSSVNHNDDLSLFRLRKTPLDGEV